MGLASVYSTHLHKALLVAYKLKTTRQIMQKITFLILTLLVWTISFAKKLETVCLDPKNSITNLYITIVPDGILIKAFMFLLVGFGTSLFVINLTMNKTPAILQSSTSGNKILFPQQHQHKKQTWVY